MLDHQGQARLEGLCQNAGIYGRVRIGTGAEGLERLEAFFKGQAFAPHRHDRYAIGVTLRGVQTFRYRGERRQCLPGEGHILHPDETHDGGAGGDDGFGYRIIYIDPALVQEALGGRPLPFAADPVVKRRDMKSLADCLADFDEPIADLDRLDIASTVAGVLERCAASSSKRRAPLHMTALSHVRDLILDDPTILHPAEEFEAVSGLDRWTVARQFRAAFGTSPTRFRTMRQLEVARGMIEGGAAICDAALDAGFADQSHMSRMFKRTYGLTPATWVRALVPRFEIRTNS